MLIWFLVVSVAVSCVNGERKAKQVSYDLLFEDAIQDCENFNNKVMDYSGMELITNSSKSWLEGNVQIHEEILSGTTMKVTVYRKEEFTGDYVLYYTLDGDLCEQMADPDVPWTVLFRAMKLSTCPIQPKTYEDVTIELNVDYAYNMLTHESVGVYKCDMEMLAPPDAGSMPPGDGRVSCHTVTTELVQIMQETE